MAARRSPIVTFTVTPYLYDRLSRFFITKNQFFLHRPLLHSFNTIIVYNANKEVCVCGLEL